MKLCLLAIGFVLLLSIDEGESSCRIVIVGLRCTKSCFWCHRVCTFSSDVVCDKDRKKRTTEEVADSGSFWVELPCKFSTWDTDKDDSITLAEFAFAGQTTAKDSNTETVFKMVDKDGNTKISREEFDAAPLLLENC